MEFLRTPKLLRICQLEHREARSEIFLAICGCQKFLLDDVVSWRSTMAIQGEVVGCAETLRLRVAGQERFCLTTLIIITKSKGLYMLPESVTRQMNV